MRRTLARRRFALAGLPGVLALLLHGCGGGVPTQPAERDGPGDMRDVSQVPDAVPRVEPRSRGGNMASYKVLGRHYTTLSDNKGFVQRGVASWYGSKFHGRRTSNGEIYDMYRMTAAHKRLPLPTYVEVTNLENGRRVIVRVNDRGPFHDNRVIDLSYAAAARIGMMDKGTALVEIRAIDPAAPGPRPPGSSTVRAAVPDAAAPSAPTDAPSARAPRIYLQAGAFSSADNAQRLRDRLESALAHRVRVVAVTSTAGPVHRVQVGPLSSVETADRVSTQMHGLGIASPLVVVD